MADWHLKQSIIIASMLLILGSSCGSAQEPGRPPLRIGVAGLTHDHVNGILRQLDRSDITIVGIYEPDQELSQRDADRYGFSTDLIFNNLEEMLDTVKPEAVTAFGSIYEHLAVVEVCAPRGIHVMVEKPLAVSVKHALAMQALANRYGIHLLTNYETTWYSSTEAAYELVHDRQKIGDIRKIVVHDGHRGPKEIGVSNEFFSWLTDPVQNAGGALIDFGCYGANLITWLMEGAQPLSVTAVTQQIKPDIYPKVDDEATIIVTYPKAQGIIQASWNWPFNRKDIEVYGQTGYVYAPDRQNIRIREGTQRQEEALSLEPRTAPLNNPFSYLAAVVRGDIKVAETDLSSLANNVTVVRILEAARESAKTGRTVYLVGR